jgi:hypothetical protein
MKRVIGRRAIQVRSATSGCSSSEIIQQSDLENGEDSTSCLTEGEETREEEEEEDNDDETTTVVGDAVCSECETGGILDT